MVVHVGTRMPDAVKISFCHAGGIQKSCSGSVNHDQCLLLLPVQEASPVMQPAFK